ADDQSVQPGVGQKGIENLFVENDGNQSAKDEEYQHPNQEDPRRRKLERVAIACHCASLAVPPLARGRRQSRPRLWHRRGESKYPGDFTRLPPMPTLDF